MTSNQAPQPRSGAPAARPPARMTLAAVTKGKIEAPPRILLVGVEGIGKTTFAAAAPSPIFLAGEDGTNQIDVARFPQPESWAEVLDAVRVLTVEPHDYRTLVVDTLDAIEPLCWAEVCRKGGKPDLESFGFGKGYVAALDEWRVFLAAVERLRKAKGMIVIFLAHAQIRAFKNPEGEDYDRFEMKLHSKTGGLIKEWTDANLFANYETFAVKERGKLVAKGVSSGARVVHTQRRAAWDAKNRFDLPEQLPLDWQAFAEAVSAHRPADPATLRTAIGKKLALADEKVAAAARAKVAQAGDDAAELARILNKLTALVAEKEQVSNVAA